MATINLSKLGSQGFVIEGYRNEDRLGSGVSDAGDFNGDGFADAIVGAYNVDEAYIVFGHDGPFDTIDPRNLRGDGMLITGKRSTVGFSVASAGDVNGDGFDDVIVGASSNYELVGGAWVVFGRAGGFKINLGRLKPETGFAITAAGHFDRTGYSVSGAGDVNGDGFDDVIVGAPFADDGGALSGNAYVIFGKAGGFGPIDLTRLAPTDGFVIQGEAHGDEAGRSVAGAGDVNGDGFDDVIVGAPESDIPGDAAGAAYLIFGKAGGFGRVDLTALTPTDGIVIRGVGKSGQAGLTVNSAGDFNGDGHADLILWAGTAGHRGGTAILFGHAGGFAGDIDLDNLAPADGIFLKGAGFVVSSAGDVNGDGIDDVIAGSPYSNDARAYVVYGRAENTGAIDVTKLTDAEGFTIRNAPGFNTHLGISVSGAGDINGDGFDDVIVGASWSDGVFSGSGNAYVIYGIKPNEAVTRTGTDIAQTIHGGFGDDTLDGRGGDDTLIGAEGRDTLTGGTGADTFRFVRGDTGADAASADLITDFHHADHDRIDLSGYDAVPTSKKMVDPFTFIGTSAFSGAAGELRYEFAGGDTLLSGDTNGDRVADFTIRLTGTVALTADDFLFAAAGSPGGGHLSPATATPYADLHLHLA